MRMNIAILMVVLISGSRSAVAADADLGRLAWLEGTWRGVTNGVAMEETWSSPSGGGLIGMHKDSRDGRMVSFEFFRIVPRDSGGTCYLSSPLGKPAVPFCATEIGDRRIVFENLQHDFPQRILYWLTPDGRLHARIEGAQAGTPSSEEWVWTKTPAPAPPPSLTTGIRNKLSANDLLSAESALEVHRAKNGEDGAYLVGLSWLARGALLVGDGEKADRYAADVRARCADSLAHGTDLMKSQNVEIALGAAIEVAAQRLERIKNRKAAANYVRDELARWGGPVAFRSRLNKRLNLLTLTGSPAPELAIEDFIGDPPPPLASLRGKPVLLFMWAEWCGDCRAQEASLARVQARYAGKGLQIIGLTRYYEPNLADRAREKARVDSAWKADYHDLGSIPIVLSTASVERYGSSSTPTFVFIDRAGIVRRYAPTRLTEAELDRTLSDLVR